MKQGYLSQYFQGVAIKTLSDVEANLNASHQHEFNGVEQLKNILGDVEGTEKKYFNARFLYFTDLDDDPETDNGKLTWYDARAKARLERGINRSECRLYFPDNKVSRCASTGDLLLIARLQKNIEGEEESVLVIVAEEASTASRQLSWLFGISELHHPGFSIKSELETEQDRLEFTSRFILENIGIELEVADETFLDSMLRQFNDGFPKTNEFSEYARSTLKDLDPHDDPDSVLMAWMDREEILFRTFERYLIADRLKTGFYDCDDESQDVDVNEFMRFSLSIQNRRKSRAGYALENHVEELFRVLKIRYSRTAITENRSKPDFLFPGKEEYHSPTFDPINLTMLGVKTTCKDRWRQVLSEAEKIRKKHLFTLESAISTHQTDEMRSKDIQLVLPSQLHGTYTMEQQKWLMKLTDFTGLVLERQNRM